MLLLIKLLLLATLNGYIYKYEHFDKDVHVLINTRDVTLIAAVSPPSFRIVYQKSNTIECTLTKYKIYKYNSFLQLPTLYWYGNYL